MPRAQPRFEEAGGQRLPLGGVNGYRGVRGKQGRKKDKFQGATPKKRHLTSLFDTALEAAIALAQLKNDLELGMVEPREKKEEPAATSCSTVWKKNVVGTYLGYMRQPQLLAAPVIPPVACAPLSREQAAAAMLRGVAVAYADQQLC